MWPLRPWGFESPFSHHPSPLRFVTLLIVMLALLAPGCTQTPSESLEATFAAAEDGDFGAFRDGFTRRSSNFLSGLEAVGARGREAFVFGPMQGRPTIVGERAVGKLVVVEAQLDGVTLPFPMVEERGRWRVDLRTATEIWYRLGTGPFAPTLLERPRLDAPRGDG